MADLNSMFSPNNELTDVQMKLLRPFGYPQPSNNDELVINPDVTQARLRQEVKDTANQKNLSQAAAPVAQDITDAAQQINPAGGGLFSSLYEHLGRPQPNLINNKSFGVLESDRNPVADDEDETAI